MPDTFRFLIAETECHQAREKRRDSTGRSSGETYAHTLLKLAPGATCDRLAPVDPDGRHPGVGEIGGYDAVFVTGSPLHVYEDTPEVRRQLDFLGAVFRAGVPAFGSCAGLQAAVVLAGGRVRKHPHGGEAGFARRVAPTDAGLSHPMLAGRPRAFDAPAIHGDEVESLPDGATLLAGNAATRVQAAEIRHGHGVFWGVQYHPEIDLGEVAAALRRQSDSLVRSGFARSPEEVGIQAVLVEALGHDPSRRDLAWRLGLDEQVTDPALRTTELRNFIDRLVKPTMSERGRG